MNGYQFDERRPWFKSKAFKLSATLLGIGMTVVFAIILENEVGVPVDMTLRVVCAITCLVFIYWLGLDYPGERWPRVSLWIALLVNVAIFFTPLVDRPVSRGELMLFASPDAVIVLSVLTLSYRVTDVHQRANRQTMILALIVAIVMCVTLFALSLMGRAAA